MSRSRISFELPKDVLDKFDSFYPSHFNTRTQALIRAMEELMQKMKEGNP